VITVFLIDYQCILFLHYLVPFLLVQLGTKSKLPAYGSYWILETSLGFISPCPCECYLISSCESFLISSHEYFVVVFWLTRLEHYGCFCISSYHLEKSMPFCLSCLPILRSDHRIDLFLWLFAVPVSSRSFEGADRFRFTI
jgi:hypothetical protein